MPKGISKHFEQGKVIDVVDTFKHLNNQISTYTPGLGPLPKTVYTYQYEELTRRLMAGGAFTCVQAEDKSTVIKFNRGKEYNLTEIVAHANLDHLTFSQSDLAQYEQYCENVSLVKPQNKYGKYPTKEYIKSIDPKGVFNEMHYAEKLALNIYSTNYYNKMNPFLRGYYNFENKKPAEIKDVIIHSAMCGQALSQAPNMDLDGSFRYEGVYDEAQLEQRIKIAEEGGAEIVRGFVSTGEEPALTYKDKVAITYTGLKGKYIGPLSRYPNEKEFLIPPAQMTYEAHVLENGVHYFHARPVIDVNLVDEKVKEIASTNTVNTTKVNELLHSLSAIDKLIKDNCPPSEYKTYKTQANEIKAWAIVKLKELNENPGSTAAIAEDLSIMWNKLSFLSANVTKNQNKLHAELKGYHQEMHQRQAGEKSIGEYQLIRECSEALHQLQTLETEGNDTSLKGHSSIFGTKYKDGFKHYDFNELIQIRDEIGKELMANKKETCLTELSDIKARGIQLNDKNLDKFIEKMYSNISRTKNIFSLDEIKEHLECKAILQKIDATRFGSNDQQMNNFVQEYQHKLDNAKGIDSLKEIKAELNFNLEAIQKNSSAIEELRSIVQNYRDKACTFTIGMKSKAKQIERAIGNDVPISERGAVQQSESVLEALASHRYHPGKVYLDQGKVDEKQASGIFQQFKEKMNKIKDKKPEKTSEVDLSPPNFAQKNSMP